MPPNPKRDHIGNVKADVKYASCLMNGMSPECLPFSIRPSAPHMRSRMASARAWPPLALTLAHGLPNRFRRIPIRNRHRIATRCHKSTDFCVATTRAWGNRLNRPGRPLLRSNTLPTSSLFVRRKATNRLSADAGTGKNVAPSFSSPGQTATGVRQAVISAPGPHWHAADRILHASVHAESPSTCTKALSACPEPRPDASMTACHGAEHPHGKPKPTYARLFPPASFEACRR